MRRLPVGCSLTFYYCIRLHFRARTVEVGRKTLGERPKTRIKSQGSPCPPTTMLKRTLHDSAATSAPVTPETYAPRTPGTPASPPATPDPKRARLAARAAARFAARVIDLTSSPFAFVDLTSPPPSSPEGADDFTNAWSARLPAILSPSLKASSSTSPNNIDGSSSEGVAPGGALGGAAAGAAAGAPAGASAGAPAGAPAGAQDAAFADCVNALVQMQDDNGAAKKDKGEPNPRHPGRAARMFTVSRSVTSEQVGLENMRKIMEHLDKIKNDPAEFEVKTATKNGIPGKRYMVHMGKTMKLLMGSAVKNTLDRDIKNLRAVLHSAGNNHMYIYCSCDLPFARTMQGRKGLTRHRAGAGSCRN